MNPGSSMPVHEVKPYSISGDFKRKAAHDLQSPLAAAVDSHFAPGGPLRTAVAKGANENWRFKDGMECGRRAYPEAFGGIPTTAAGWDSVWTKKHNLTVALPPGVEERVQRRAWKEVGRYFHGMGKGEGRRGFHIQAELMPLATSKSVCFLTQVDSHYMKRFGSQFNDQLPDPEIERRKARATQARMQARPSAFRYQRRIDYGPDSVAHALR